MLADTFRSMSRSGSGVLVQTEFPPYGSSAPLVLTIVNWFDDQVHSVANVIMPASQLFQVLKAVLDRFRSKGADVSFGSTSAMRLRPYETFVSAKTAIVIWPASVAPPPSVMVYVKTSLRTSPDPKLLLKGTYE